MTDASTPPKGEREDQTFLVTSLEDQGEDPVRSVVFQKSLKIFRGYSNKDGNVDADNVPEAIGEILHTLWEEDGIAFHITPFRG